MWYLSDDLKQTMHIRVVRTEKINSFTYKTTSHKVHIKVKFGANTLILEQWYVKTLADIGIIVCKQTNVLISHCSKIGFNLFLYDDTIAGRPNTYLLLLSSKTLNLWPPYPRYTDFNLVIRRWKWMWSFMKINNYVTKKNKK